MSKSSSTLSHDIENPPYGLDQVCSKVELNRSVLRLVCIYEMRYGRQAPIGCSSSSSLIQNARGCPDKLLFLFLLFRRFERRHRNRI